MTLKLDARNRITLPKEVLSQLNIKSGDLIELYICNDEARFSRKMHGENLMKVGPLLVYTGDIPDINIEAAIEEDRKKPRL